MIPTTGLNQWGNEEVMGEICWCFTVVSRESLEVAVLIVATSLRAFSVLLSNKINDK